MSFSPKHFSFAMLSFEILVWMMILCTLILEFLGFKDSLTEAEIEVQEISEACVDSECSPEGKADEKGKDKEDRDIEKNRDPEKERYKEKDSERKGENDKDKIKSLDGTNLDGLLQRLPGCVSRDLIDQLTVITMTFNDFFFYF